MKHAIAAALRFPTSGAHRTLLAATIAALSATVAVFDRASAQTAFTLPAPPFELPLLPPVSGNWTVMIGAEGRYRPDFEGANHSLFSPIPIFSIRRAGSVDQFRSPRDNASIALIDFGDLRAGPAGKFVSSRKASSYSELNGLGDVKAAFELGGFVEYFPVDWFRVRNEIREGLGGHQGVVADFSADFIVPVTRRSPSLRGRASPGKARRPSRPISMSTPCRRRPPGFRSSTPRAAHTRLASARR